MGEAANDALLGVKTFFVVPDLSVFPEENLKTFFLKGYETYFIDDDPYCPLAAKIRLLVSTFNELILFFNIDRNVQGIDWPVFIGNLQSAYGSRVTIGVMFQKRNTPEEMRRLERLYLFDIGIVGGCVPLEYQKSKNIPRFQNVLMANQANGQRKQLRALCNDSFKLNLQYKDKSYRCVIRDISISHFSCVFCGDRPEIPANEKISNIQMNLHGILCNVDGVLCLKRMCAQDLIHVFIFRTQQNKNGLNPDQLNRINTIVYNLVQAGVSAFLKALFQEERQKTPGTRTTGPAFKPSTGMDLPNIGEECLLEAID